MTKLFAASARGLKWLAMLVAACAIAVVLQFAIVDKAWAVDRPVSTYGELTSEIAAAAPGDVIVLTADITMTSSAAIPTGLAVTITSDSSGPHSLLRDAGFNSYLVGIVGDLTIEDVVLDGNGGGGYALVYVYSGNLTINSGAVLTNNNGGTGGAIFNYGGTVTMNDGLISNNTASVGGGIYNYSGGSLTMNGGVIRDNTASGHAGGIDNNGGSTVATGGSILGNWSPGIGSAVYYHSGGTASIGSGVIVEHSINGIVFDASDNTITLPASVQLMNGTTPVGSPVTAAADGTFRILFMPDAADYSAYSLLVTYPGYGNRTVSFTVDAWEDARNLNIALNPLAISLTLYPVIEHYGEYGGSGSSTAIIDAIYGTAPFNSLVLYLADGSYVTVDPSMYSVSADANGKLAITLSQQYLQTFGPGRYFFRAIFDDGESDPIILDLPNSALPATGDSLLPLSALVLSFMVAALLIVCGTRRMRTGCIRK